MFKNKCLSMLLLFGFLAVLLAPLSTGLSGIASAQESAETKMSYLPLISLGGSEHLTINIINNDAVGSDVRVTAYSYDGKFLGEVLAITWIEAGESVEIAADVLPSSTVSLKIESNKHIEAKSVYASDDGKTREIIPAIDLLSSRLDLLELGVGDSHHKTLMLLNPQTSVATIEVIALNKEGHEIGRFTLNPLSSMQSLGINIFDIFDTTILEDIHTITILSNNDILGVQSVSYPEKDPETFPALPALRTVNEMPHDYAILNSVQTATSTFYLMFPIAIYTPFNVPISSVFDHAMTTPYTPKDGSIVAYTGEKGLKTVGASCDCYKNSSGLPFSIDNRYKGASSCGGTYYLCYDGHPGYDYPVPSGTEVRAAAGGVITTGWNNCYGNYVRIDHQDGYQTDYFHLSSVSTFSNPNIGIGTPIGKSGNTGSKECTSGAHLHFEVRKNGVPVDPYGWKGSTTDPYTKAVNINLWNISTTPTLRVDGVTSSTKSQGGTFTLTGSNYTPNGTITRYVNGSSVGTITASSTGTISNWTWPTNCSTATGTYTVYAKDNTTGKSSNTITEVVTSSSSCTIRPNLTPYTPTGWSAPIVVSKTTLTHTDSSPLYTTDFLSVDWAVLNNGTASVSSNFYSYLYVDGILKKSWYISPPLSSNYYTSVSDYAMGWLTAGTHTIKLVTDATGVITESNEGDNQYTKTITVLTSSSTPTLRVDGVTSSTKSQGGTFTLTGFNYTPNGTITRYVNGSSIGTITASSTGTISSWTWPTNCTTPTGTYTVYAKDNTTGKTSNTITEVVTSSSSCSTPQYEGWVDAADCSSIRGWAWDKIQPNTPINVDIYDGSTKLTTVAANVFRQDLVNAGKGNGYHGFSYATPSSLKNAAAHSVSVKYSGTSTNLSGSPKSLTCGGTPTLLIDGGTSSTKAQGGTFTTTGTNYTPNGAVTRYLKQPNGTTITLTPTLYANSNGAISWSFTSICTTPTGTSSIWVADNTTGKTSNTVSEVVTASSSCNPTLLINGGTSSTKAQGGTFTTTGTNYTPNGAVTRYLKQPNGTTITLTPTLYANSNGAISWSFTSICTTPTGTSSIWVKDNATGKTSNTVSEIITHSSSCP